MALVELRALGECAIETDSGRIGPDSKYVFALGLYLVLERGKRIPRQALVDLLWPDVRDERQARHRFRQTLLRLKQLGVPVSTDQAHLRLERTAAITDFDSLLNVNGDAEEVVRSRESFEFLHGYQPRISEPFGTWLDLHRARIELAIQRVFIHALKAARDRGDWGAVEQLALGCLRIDPLNEEATMARAEATAMRGSKAQALRILDSYMDALGERSLSIGLPAKMLRSRIAERMTQPQYMTLSEAHFVGREAEVTLLTGMLSEAKQCRGSAILLRGAAGIGKTRLVTEISGVAALKGTTVIAVNCQPTSVDRPIGLLADLVTALRTAPGSLGAAVESLALLQRLTEYTEPAPALYEFGETGVAGAAIRRAVFDLFEAVAEENTLLVTLEDVHWADAFSWKMVRTLAEMTSRRRVLIVATSRPLAADVEQASSDLAVDSFHIRDLPPLDPAASQTLLTKLIADYGSDIPPEMLAWCVSVAEGNPYYLRELLTRWLETGEPFGVPKSLSELVDRRLGRLSADALRVFQACVAFGSACTVPRLERVEATAAIHLPRCLEELSLAGFIVCDGVQLNSRHDLLAQAAHKRLSPAVKALIHQRIAGVLETEAKVEPEPRTFWDCAHHWLAAGDAPRAVSFLDDCGRHLMALGLADEAAALYRQATHLQGTTIDQTLTLQHGLIRALRQAGLMEQVLTEVAMLRQWAQNAGRHIKPHSDLELLEAEARWRVDPAAVATLDQLMECVSAPEASGEHRLNAAFWLLAVAHTTGNPDAAHKAWERLKSLVLNESSDPIPRCLVAMVYHTDYGDIGEAARYANQLVENARRHTVAALLPRMLRNAALALRRCGRRAEAKGLLYEAFELAVTHHAALYAADVAQLQAGMCADDGDYDNAADWLEKSDEWLRKCESPLLVQNGLMTKARVAALTEHWENARAIVRTLPEWRDERNLRWKQMIVSLQLMIAVHDGDQTLTHELLREAESCYARFGSSGQQDYAVECLATAYYQTGERARARLVIEEYLTRRRRDRGERTRTLRKLEVITGAQLE